MKQNNILYTYCNFFVVYILDFKPEMSDKILSFINSYSYNVQSILIKLIKIILEVHLKSYAVYVVFKKLKIEYTYDKPTFCHFKSARPR